MITEYCHAPQTQTKRFHAEIELFTISEIKQTFQNFLQAHYEFFCDPPNDLEGEVKEVLDLEAQAALTAFTELFVDHEECRNKEAANEFLKTATSSVDMGILTTLMRWVEELISIYEGDFGRIYLLHDSSERLSVQLQVFVAMNTAFEGEDGRPSPALWPIVRKVRVRFHSPFLARGIVLADLPVSDIFHHQCL